VCIHSVQRSRECVLSFCHEYCEGQILWGISQFIIVEVYICGDLCVHVYVICSCISVRVCVCVYPYYMYIHLYVYVLSE